MNIQEAKDEIKRTLRIYTQKTADGRYRIPLNKQRPVLLIGPPGIGKTAIMEQIARETGCGLVSYTMTHHTRQSAIGLPFIREREFGGRPCTTTEYTMSEIVASMYSYMEETGITDGILFLDEINCVSETLAPVMLQLLQNKTFGNHPIPEGWVIVAAGNPPEYNKSVRELDVATMDRVKGIDVEADLNTWLRYAARQGVHPAIRAYLQLNPDHFYCIQDRNNEHSFVTARGWEDLSLMLTACEEDGESVGEALFLQYIQHEAIAHSFSLFYRYFADACRELSGRELMSSMDPGRMNGAEILAVTASFFDQIRSSACTLNETRRLVQALQSELAVLNGNELTDAFFADRRRAMNIRAEKQLSSSEELFFREDVLRRLEEISVPEHAMFTDSGESSEQRSSRRLEFRRQILSGLEDDLRGKGTQITDLISDLYLLLERSPIAGAAALYLTNDLVNDADCRQLLLEHPCDAYSRHAEELLETLED